MRFVSLLPVLVTIASVIGCGGSNRQIKQLRTDQAKAIDGLRQEIAELTTTMHQLQAELQLVNGELFDLSAELDHLRTAQRQTPPPATETGETRTEPEGGTVASIELVEPTMEAMSAALTEMNEQMEAMRQQYENDKKHEELRDPTRTWHALGNPEEIANRLDALAEQHAATIDDEVARQAFLDDVTALKEQINERAQMPLEDKIEQQKQHLYEEIQNEENEFAQHFLEQQLKVLEEQPAQIARVFIDSTDRMENMSTISEFAEQHDIPNETLSDHGLLPAGPGGGAIFLDFKKSSDSKGAPE